MGFSQHLIAPEKMLSFGLDSGTNVNFQLIGDDSFTITISKIMSPFPCFLLNFGNIGEKYTGATYFLAVKS